MLGYTLPAFVLCVNYSSEYVHFGQGDGDEAGSVDAQ